FFLPKAVTLALILYPLLHTLHSSFLVFFFFFLLLRPPPRPPLFPYTTLFRSLEGLLVERGARVEYEQYDPPAPSLEGRVDLRDLDRKSTRLNSSHQIISYAVFCLKKKKKKNTTKTTYKKTIE